ncbi:MAG: UDP-N-acetylmuramoyl-L-alanyl-D-glutamate--2,6-diaminopimelate ligase [Deltaproteobacteria bacterium]|nr:UDP-N-acetylmuramoyl-L-alanyl-D-glutamate--2,6-diaminopimelate ligase [Deltaproteobacteria bacterium]
MKLSELIKNLPDKNVIGSAEIPICGIAYDSRKADKDCIFAAIKGERLDGSKFIHDAIKRGAAAVLAENAAAGISATQVIVPDVREAMARLASAFYGEPSRKMTLIGVTGTNGKTTITYLVESILSSAGFNAGVVGTINYRYKDKIFHAPHTTPEAPDLQRVLNEMIDSGITHCVMEVSSHSLAQKRVDSCRFAGGTFTNLTRDHLDYHRTMEEYFESKSRLFIDFIAKEKKGFAVINVDDLWGEKLLNLKFKISNFKFIRYSLKQDAEIKPSKVSFSERGIEAMLDTSIGSVKISSPFLGEYNLQNIMAAVGIGIGLGLGKQVIENGIAILKRVPGRLERVDSKDGFQAVIDYAHTGDALERALNTLRPLTKGRLITVFGCGGDRDRGKRPIMGEIATRLSDFTIITSDNPRSEEPMEIIKEIEKGVKETYLAIPDRHEAIRAAVDMAVSGDIILVAGKGHEDYQIIGNKKFHFDDTEEIKKAMKDRL